MYLTINQHDRLRTIVMGFEIPFRTYVAKILLENYTKVNEFCIALRNKNTIEEDYSQTFKSQIGKIKSQPERIYNLLECTLDSMQKRVIEAEVNVPDVATIVGLIFIFEDIFCDFIKIYENKDNFINQIEKYHYVRNKLNHPGCKTLEEQDLVIVLNFITNACIFIDIEYEECFGEKQKMNFIEKFEP